MTGRQSDISLGALKNAMHKLKPALIALQWLGNLVGVLLAVAWLQIPDSHSWQFALSMLAGVLIVLVFLWLQAATYRRVLANTTPVPLPVQLLVLAVVVSVWMALLRPIATGRDVETLLASYANSKLPLHLRSFFSLTRLVRWQDHLYDVVQLLFAGFLLPPTMEVVGSGMRSVSFKRAGRVYEHWLYWVVICVFGLSGIQLTAAMVRWTPGKGIAGESANVLARFGFAYSADILLWCLVLALTALLLDEGRADPKPAEFSPHKRTSGG